MRPRVAITVGDPSGIGPEIAARAASDRRVTEVCEPIVYAPERLDRFVPGQVSAEAGQAAYDTIVRVVDDARAGRVDAIATAPINKLALARAGLPWKGHTDLLAHLCGVERVVMMFHAPATEVEEPASPKRDARRPGLNVALATVHVPLADVPGLLTLDAVTSTIALVAHELPLFGVERPRLALAGLNPHAGEEGVLGSEDGRVLAPAVEACRARGIDVVGPLPADTVFVRAIRGEFDAVVACYHDQGLIPVKLLAFGISVNVTLGLPIVRTSVDHGTAFDIAGQGKADAGSMIEAVRLAARLAESKAALKGGLYKARV
jgi:4-hydroxythreonine-4-phosphate dehydrogenase